MIANLLWLWFAFYSIDLLFNQVEVIAGWNALDAKMLVTVYSLFLTLVWVFIMPNLIVFWRLINAGTMDFHLLKPISARFLSSATYFEFDMIPRLIPIVLVMGTVISSLSRVISWDEWVIFWLTMMLGVIIFYNFGFMIATTCFWFTKIDSLEDFLNATQAISKYPPDIFKGIPRVVFVYLVPSIFLAAFPTMVLLGRGKFDILTLSLLGVVVSTVASQKFWHFALRHYSSASS